jgi:pimeloyl-ACP methyl ester carboxylesterase
LIEIEVGRLEMEQEKMTDRTRRANEVRFPEPSSGISRRHFAKTALAAASAGLLLPRAAFGLTQESASHPAASPAANIVLVHGAWADGSSWSRVIPLLEAKGLYVSAVQIPLTSLADDVASTRRALARQSGPTILVGHSYAGFVVTEAGNAPNVVGLVYVSSYGPDEGESHDDLVKRFPAPPGVAAVQLGDDGFLLLERGKFAQNFAQDVDHAQAEIMSVVQKPLSKKMCFGVPVTQPAWKSKPSWFLLSTDDRMVSPDLQRFMAERMHAKVVSVPSSHASLVSHPAETASLIMDAAGHNS